MNVYSRHHLSTAQPTVAALYVAAKGVYFDLGADCYDIERDATTYASDLPIVAHPPCRKWGKLSWAAKGDDKHLAWIALDQVRRCGGVLEHPVGSRFFKEAGINVPKEHGTFGEFDEVGGAVFRLRQYNFGHRGHKDTLFYIFGTLALPVLWSRQDDSAYPVQNMAQKERLATPEPMARWLMRVAESCAAPKDFDELLRQHGITK